MSVTGKTACSHTHSLCDTLSAATLLLMQYVLSKLTHHKALACVLISPR